MQKTKFSHDLHQGQKSGNFFLDLITMGRSIPADQELYNHAHRGAIEVSGDVTLVLEHNVRGIEFSFPTKKLSRRLTATGEAIPDFMIKDKEL